MKSSLTTEWIKKQYWTCNVNTHRHKTREVAEDCIKRLSGSSYFKEVDELKRRDLNIVEDWVSGLSFTDIAYKYGRSTTRMRQVVDRYLLIARWHTEGRFNLKTREYDIPENCENGKTDLFKHGSIYWRPGLTDDLTKRKHGAG